jgi:aspartyl-tRNA synthetase
MVADSPQVVNEVLGFLRSYIAERLKLVDSRVFKFVWVTDFPMFTYNEDSKKYEPEHHPFTSPREKDLPLLDTDPGKVKARSYDLVLNGVEIGSGSIRIHRKELQEKIFRIIGISPEEAKERFGFFLEALDYGAPPHCGIAPGLDRIVMLMAGCDSIREVIAFPKTQKAACPLTGAPSAVDPRQLKELHIKLDV